MHASRYTIILKDMQIETRNDRRASTNPSTRLTLFVHLLSVQGWPMLQRQKPAALYFLPKRDWPNHPFDFSLDKYKPAPLMEST